MTDARSGTPVQITYGAAYSSFQKTLDGKVHYFTITYERDVNRYQIHVYRNLENSSDSVTTICNDLDIVAVRNTCNEIKRSLERDPAIYDQWLEAAKKNGVRPN